MKTKLLNIDQNAKTVKGNVRGFITAILYLSPADSSGVQLCPLAEKAKCKTPCLNQAGRGGMSAGNATFVTDSGVELADNAIQRARLRRTRLFLDDQAAFMTLLVHEIEKALVLADRKGKTLVMRPNGTSDIRWENIPCTRNGVDYPNIFAAFPNVQFYDYTKIPNRRVAHIPNYSLTFSYSHVSEFAPIVVKALKHYGASVNFAAVFHGKVPESFLGRTVINGDETDPVDGVGPVSAGAQVGDGLGLARDAFPGKLLVEAVVVAQREPGGTSHDGVGAGAEVRVVLEAVDGGEFPVAGRGIDPLRHLGLGEGGGLAVQALEGGDAGAGPELARQEGGVVHLEGLGEVDLEAAPKAVGDEPVGPEA